MGREVDRRDWAANRVTPARQEELRNLAVSASSRLAGAHEVHIEGFDPATGNPSMVASALAEPERDNHIQRALDHVRSIGRVLGLSATQPAEYAADPNVQHTSSGAVTVHLQQQYKGIPIFQAAQAVRFAPDDRLEDTAGTTVTVDVEIPVAARVSVQDAVLAAARHVAVPGQDELAKADQFGQRVELPGVDVSGYTPRIIATFPDKPDQPTTLDGGPFGSPIKADLIWFPMGDDLKLAWQVIVTMPADSGQFRTLVDAQSGEILFCRQLMHLLTASGNVFLTDGSAPRQVRDFPLDLAAFDLPIPPEVPPTFPDPWVVTDSTVGNCVRAHLGVTGPALRGERTGDVVKFNPGSDTGDDQKVLNIFFYNNLMHDYTYLLGFREADGNFQADNLGRGGTPGDSVDARAHSGAVSGTANMSTPPDGSSPVMNMGLVTSTNRHTAMDASVVFHEYMHGVTNRLVGGRMNASALDAPQPVGMGEGWSDYIACTILGTTTVGGWVVNNTRGIRNFPYDSSFPDHFGKLGTGRYAADPSSGFPQSEHNVGEIWCATLLEMNRRLDAELGAPGGRHLSIQLVVDALKLSPALPSFLDMRDAILRAVDNKRAAGQLDADRHARGRHAILATFARFGMGPAARSNGSTLAGIVADFTPPPPLATPGPGDPGTTPGPVSPGDTVRAEESPDVSIPDSQPNGVSRVLSIASAGRIRRASVDLEIRHPFVGDLIVSLVPPGGAPIVLHNRAGGNADDIVKTFRSEDTPALAALAGTGAQGNWTLKVADVAARDLGSLKRWAIELGLASAPPVARGEASPALAIPDNDPAGVRSAIAIAGAGQVGSIKVGVNISHTFIGDLKVELVSPTGRRAVLHDRKGGGMDNIISTFDSSTTPGLAALAGEAIAGNWTLEVRDLEAVDVGRLNQWSIELTPQPSS